MDISIDGSWTWKKGITEQLLKQKKVDKNPVPKQGSRYEPGLRNEAEIHKVIVGLI